MQQHSRLITLIGGILAFFSFALPWDADYSGAELANIGEGTLVTIALIASLVFIGISFYMLNRHTSWNPVSIIVALIISSMLLAFFSFFIIEIVNSRIEAIIILFIAAIAIFGISAYLSKYRLSLTPFILLILIGGSIGTISCLIVVFRFLDSGFNFIIISFIASLAIISVGTFRLIQHPPWKSWSTFLVLISSSVGLCCFLILFLGNSLNIEMGGNRLYSPRYGAFMTAVGYILAMIGVLGSLAKANNSEYQGTQEEEVNSRGDES